MLISSSLYRLLRCVIFSLLLAKFIASSLKNVFIIVIKYFVNGKWKTISILVIANLSIWAGFIRCNYFRICFTKEVNWIPLKVTTIRPFYLWSSLKFEAVELRGSRVNFFKMKNFVINDHVSHCNCYFTLVTLHFSHM